MEVEGVGGIAWMPTVLLDLGILLQDARILCGSDHCLMGESGCWKDIPPGWDRLGGRVSCPSPSRETALNTSTGQQTEHLNEGDHLD